MVYTLTLLVIVFPAHAGMSLVVIRAQFNFNSFPRTRGDEPISKGLDAANSAFSPHTRG